MFLLLTLAACSLQSPTAHPQSGASAHPTRNSHTPHSNPNLDSLSYVNPVLDCDFPDPGLYKFGDCYFAYATNSRGIHVQTASSPDLVHWELLGDALPVLPAWADPRFGRTWAPNVTPGPDGQTLLMYYTTRYLAGGRQAVAVARADNPAGPFQTVGDEPLVCNLAEGGDIDPYAFTDADGTRYLIYKNDGNSCGRQTWIYIQKLAAAGLSLDGEPTRLITADRDWEGRLVEAPTLWLHDGRYYLFYSANSFKSPRYAVGYAVADHLYGPYVKADRPVLATSAQDCIVGPGGQDIIVDHHGRTWMFYHAWSPGGYRSMHLSPLAWQDGVPVILSRVKT